MLESQAFKYFAGHIFGLEVLIFHDWLAYARLEHQHAQFLELFTKGFNLFVVAFGATDDD